MPTIQDAARTLDEIAPSMTIALVDCAVEEELCRGLEVSSFPAFY